MFREYNYETSMVGFGGKWGMDLGFKYGWNYPIIDLHWKKRGNQSPLFVLLQKLFDV